MCIERIDRDGTVSVPRTVKKQKSPVPFETDDSAVPLKFTVGTVPSQVLTHPGETLARHTGDPTRGKPPSNLRLGSHRHVLSG